MRLTLDNLTWVAEPPVLLADVLRERAPWFSFPCGGRGTCGNCTCTVNGVSVRACQTVLTQDSVIRLADQRMEVLRAEGSAPGDIAVDIGTTTVAASNGRVSVGERNAQAAYGADVLSRITADYAAQTRLIRAQVAKLCERLGGAPRVVTGNTVMLTLYAGLDPTPLGESPFHCPSLFGEEVDGAYLAPCINAFLGGDAVCAILAAGMTERDETALLLDFGTNGEMALYHNGSLLCTSAAMGPCLEGASITHGMAAQRGAIDHVDRDLRCTTIDHAPPRGLCGSGLVDAAAALLARGALDKGGRLTPPRVRLGGRVFLTQSDIRALQAAKAAIAAGIEILCAEAGITPREVARIYLAGAFGTFLPLESAMAIGLLPDVPKERFTALGNAALQGSLLLRDEEKRLTAQKIARMAQPISLAATERFSALFLEKMSF